MRFRSVLLEFIDLLHYRVPTSPPPAHRLTGLTLENGWHVTELQQRTTSATGGTFSVGYLVENKGAGRLGFLKALDFSGALKTQDPPRVLQNLTVAFNYERDLLMLARQKSMSRVATTIEDGAVDVDSSVIGRVPYLIFDRADSDIRSLQQARSFDNSWILRSLHQLTVGVSQLNGNGIAHQDVKPSNTLVFSGVGTKISDLGRAVIKGSVSPYDGLAIAGDPGYAPPELLYSYTSRDWDKHRIGCDLYQLGSMFVFLFTQTTVNALVYAHMSRAHLPMFWTGTFEDVLPFIQMAFASAMADFRTSLPDDFGDEMVEMVAQLCNPKPEERGHPRNRIGHSNPYSLERYVSRLDLLARRAERGLTTSVQ